MKRFVLAVVVFAGLVGCGDNGLPRSGSVIPSVTPAQASVQAGGTVTLTGNATGFTRGPLVMWWIQESKQNSSMDDCGRLDSQSKDFTGCPYGFVMFHDVSEFPSEATYYAPPTPGTYHVVFRALQVAAYDSVDKQATATITVTP